MRIIQSFWSKPFFADGAPELNYRSKGGWISSKIFFMSFALSCLRLAKYYKDVHLVTDLIGKKILIDEMGLPYNSVSTELETLKDFDEGLWALGKLYTYGNQTQPFLHVDSDFFIWQPFEKTLLNSDLIAQNAELFHEMDFYDVICKQVDNTFSYIPKIAGEYVRNGGHLGGVSGYNAGIFGGNDVELFKILSQTAFDTIEKNHKHLKDVNLGLLNVFLEQGMFLCLATQRGKKVATLLKYVDKDFSQLVDFISIPETPIIHLVGKSKQTVFANEQVYLRLKIESPYYFEKINSYCHEYDHV